VKAANEVAAKLSGILDIPKRVMLERLLTKKPFVGSSGSGARPRSRRYAPWRLNPWACCRKQPPTIPGKPGLPDPWLHEHDGKRPVGVEQAYDEELSGVQGTLIAPRMRGHLLILQEKLRQGAGERMSMQPHH